MRTLIPKLVSDKKGQAGILSQAPGALIALGVIAIVGGIVATILTQVQANQTTNTFAYNASQNGLSAVNNVSSFFPTIGTIVAAVIIIGLLLAGFGVLMSRGKR